MSENSPKNTIGKYNRFNEIVKTIYNEELEQIDYDSMIEIKIKKLIKLQPEIIYDRFSKEIKIEFKIGNNKMFRIKNLSEFYNRMVNKENYRYGDSVQFIHSKEYFDTDSQQILEFLMKYAELISITNSNANSNYRYYGKVLNEDYIIIGNSAIDELFEILVNKKIPFTKEKEKTFLQFIDKNPDINFLLEKVDKDEYQIKPNFNIYKIDIIKGKKYKYALINDKLYRCDEQFQSCNLKLLQLFKEQFSDKILLGKNEINKLFSIVIPKVKNAIVIDKKVKEELKEYQPENLGVKVFLDFDQNDYIIADVRMCYGDNEFNPLNEQEEKNFKFPRNMIEETKSMNYFKNSGFMFDVKNYRFILPEDEKIYDFLSNDINFYMKKFEVLVTDNFKTKKLVQPKIGTVGVKIENDLLSIDISNLNMDLAELQDILKKYKLKKKFYRLKDGSFLDLDQNNEIEFIDRLLFGTEINFEDIKNGSIKIPKNRSFYLEQLLKNTNGIEVVKEKEYKNLITGFSKDSLGYCELPSDLENVLRLYQKIGYEWLNTLDLYNFGGILADDMGLGKTLQVITVMLNYINNNLDRKTSIVITPSSLSLNWKNEIEKFAPKINVKVIRGNVEERKKIIQNIEKYDVVITSYELLKRDINLYKDKNYRFKYIIADEAQYLKNNNTKNAKSIKILDADTRFALTGTPIENSLSELWSIFDFIMPGYLFSYKEFKSKYETYIVKEEDVEKMDKLKMLIKPFILRRIKEEVLTELPEKTVTVLKNEMEDEQQNVYYSYLMQAKKEIQNEIDVNGFEKSHMKILAALTRLRQICCHPSLFIDNYKSGSSKLEQCMEIIEDGVTAGHKILLFSTYTSMFEIIQKELENKKIKFFKLTGETKIDERISLVDEFNQNDEIKVFLISLKAGGTGLNLTGADMVIHYDPWWNISAENQATDRAYRIGQKNNVQVYKLITKDSIEEKIYELQKKKEKLMNNILNTKTTFINKLSKEDIMELFK